MYRETADDLNRKYGHTYVLFKNKLAFVNEFQEGEDYIVMYGTYAGSSDRFAERFKEEELQTILPESKFVAINPSTKLKGPQWLCGRLIRTPRRQWKRSISADSYMFYNPNGQIAHSYWGFGGSIPKLNSQLGFDLVDSALKNVYPTLKEARTLLETHPTVALSPEYALMWHSQHAADFLLFSRAGAIGTMQETMKRIVVAHQASYQEVCDWIKRSNLDMEVANA